MKDFQANIEVKVDAKEAEQIKTLFASEDQELSNNRASYTINSSDEKIVFVITANDAVALRAMSNAICKTLSVYEKMSKI